MNRETIKLHDGKEFVLIFSLPRKFVPEGIQVIPSSGGNSPAPQEQKISDDVRFSKVQLDLVGLTSRCSVDSINVRESREYCRVYVNCTVGTGDHTGFNHWSGPYETFVKKAVSRTWGKAVLKGSADKDRMSLELRNGGSEITETKIMFAIGQ